MTKNVGVGSTAGSSKYTFSNITDYSEFNFVITVQDSNNVVSTYTVLMKFDTESLFTFDSMRITYTDTQNSTSSSTVLYNEKGTDGYYRNSAGDNITKAKIDLISGSYVMNTGVTIMKVVIMRLI